MGKVTQARARTQALRESSMITLKMITQEERHRFNT